MTVISCKGHPFRIQEGKVHPAYSLNCFTEDEAPFRDEYWLIRQGDVVVDAGASYGAYTLTALAAGAKVYAFEPEPTVAVDLRRNVELNGWEDRCAVLELALSDQEQLIDMRLTAPHWPAQTISRPYHAERLDAVLDVGGLERIDWVKIDTEGNEVDVLRGAAEALSKFHPVCIIECHVFLDAALTDRCRELLQSYGYDHFEFVQRPPCEMLIGKQRWLEQETP